ANSNDPTQLIVGSVGGNLHITSSLTPEQPATSLVPTSIRQDVNSISASIQQAQLQQLFAAAALQSATQGNNNSVLPAQVTVGQQQLLNQLIAQQSQLLSANYVCDRIFKCGSIAFSVQVYVDIK
ncbi:unnamed protein product, partial [Trichobilharzia regenti]